jgi:hypothetical protein
MLFIVFSFSESLSKGFLGSDIYERDDLRYIEAGKLYMNSAKGIIDYNALESALDTIETFGTHDHGIELWYWIVSILMYLFHSVVFIQLLNILFAVVSIRCIYDICCYIYNNRIAKLAAALYAFLPYPIIFCCFLYKDQFYTMLTLLLFRRAFQCAGHIKVWDIIYLLVGLYLSLLTRMGVAVILFALIMVIIYKQGGYVVSMVKILIGVLLFVAAVSLAVYLSWDTLLSKVNHFFLTEYELSNSTIDMVVIRSPLQLYKYPFAYLFALIQPLNTRLTFETWYDLAGILNYVILPIAIGNVLYLVDYKIKKDYLFWLIHILYLLVILTSLGITRHQYFLQPFMMILFACFYYRTKNRIWLKITSLSTIAVSSVLLLVVIFK